jgi:hypothetical protein
VQGGRPDREVGGKLLFADLAEGVVVEQDVLDRDAVFYGRGEPGGVLAETRATLQARRRLNALGPLLAARA